MILGWDIGGVNTKVARVLDDGSTIARARAFELQRDPDALVQVLCELAEEVGASPISTFRCAVTMTAELSQMFRTKREGVHFVLDAVEEAFPQADTRVFTTDGRFLTPTEAREQVLAVAAANWAATARLVAERHPTALLVDIGTTTTDIIPIVDSSVAAVGATDPERLASGELVYTGAVRTPVEAIVRDVPYRGGRAHVSAEAFALVGDAHLWRGGLTALDYSVATPDGRPATRELAGERLARVVCADRELLDEHAITAMADAIVAEQIDTIASAIKRVASPHPTIRTAVVTGVGAFIAEDAARLAGLDVMALADDIGEDAARYAPAAAVALLCARAGVVVAGSALPRDDGAERNPAYTTGHVVDLVIKVGGGLLAHVEHLDRVLQAIGDRARTCRVLVVPGGGPFAETVRQVDLRLGVGDDAAHWMAILGMDQYAHVLASRVERGVVVASRDHIVAAVASGQVPVLAPSRWLSSVDPLPHSWDVTSDSIAAWLAGTLNAPQLVLVKPPGARGSELVDAGFARTLPSGLRHHIVAADDAAPLLTQIAGSVNAAFDTT